MSSSSISPIKIGSRADCRSNTHSFQRTWLVFAFTLELDFIHFIGFRTEVTAVLLRGWNLTLALLVTAFVPALHIHDVFHNLPYSLELCRSVAWGASAPFFVRMLLGCLVQELPQRRLHARDFVFQSLRVGLRFLNHCAGLADVCGRQICLQERLEIVQVAHKGLQLTSDVAQSDAEFIVVLHDFGPPLRAGLSQSWV